jgi:hypothetical protein
MSSKGSKRANSSGETRITKTIKVWKQITTHQAAAEVIAKKLKIEDINNVT